MCLEKYLQYTFFFFFFKYLQILCSNKAQVYIQMAQQQQYFEEKQNLLKSAYSDAKMAQSLLPTWFKPYLRKGRILVCIVPSFYIVYSSLYSLSL